MIRKALLSLDKTNRFFLERTWNESKKRVLYILLNPSMADSKIDDPTTKKLISFTKKWGYGGFSLCNLYSFRTSCPKVLYKSLEKSNKKNKEYLKTHIYKSHKIIYGWGATEKEPKWLIKLVKTPYCFGKNQNQTPKHPLYLKNDTKLIEFR